MRDDRGDAAPASPFLGLVICLAVGAGLFLFAAAAHLPRDRVLYTGLGAGLILATLLRPAWFWEHPKARWLRNLVGDEATALFYLAVGGACVWIGVFTQLPFGRSR
ncbi:MAG TPA: hypothetical protein VFQ38_08450 [Longimicrobiales bacterium]|nr:hypothetical protein [Longimicrobiales bacterium]